MYEGARDSFAVERISFLAPAYRKLQTSGIVHARLASCRADLQIFKIIPQDVVTGKDGPKKVLGLGMGRTNFCWPEEAAPPQECGEEKVAPLLFLLWVALARRHCDGL